MEHVFCNGTVVRQAKWVLLTFLMTSSWLPLSDAATPTGPWTTNFEAAAARAKAEGRPMLAAVTAVWCGPCRQMQQLTLNEAEVARYAAEHFVTVAIDGDQRADLLGKLGVAAFPTTLVLNPDGSVAHRWVGFQSAASFRQDLVPFAKTTGTSPGASQPAEAEFPPVSAIFPMNASPSGFGGFCLVSLLDDNVLQRGMEHYFAEFRGIRVIFRSEAHRDKFLANPDRYWPAANGTCLVKSKDQQASEPGDPRVGVYWKNRLWFFSDQDSQRRFMAAPDQFSHGI